MIKMTLLSEVVIIAEAVIIATNDDVVSVRCVENGMPLILHL